MLWQIYRYDDVILLLSLIYFCYSISYGQCYDNSSFIISELYLIALISRKWNNNVFINFKNNKYLFIYLLYTLTMYIII
jgi:hypothetical protein